MDEFTQRRIDNDQFGYDAMTLLQNAIDQRVDSLIEQYLGTLTFEEMYDDFEGFDNVVRIDKGE